MTNIKKIRTIRRLVDGFLVPVSYPDKRFFKKNHSLPTEGSKFEPIVFAQLAGSRGFYYKLLNMSV